MSEVIGSSTDEVSRANGTLQLTATSKSAKTDIKIGDTEYSIDVSRIPYLKSFARFQGAAQPDKKLVHAAIPLFDVALKGLELGYRQCFRSLPADISQYHTLYETYEFLNINVLADLAMDGIIANLKVARDDYDRIGGRTYKINGNKRVARDTAFQLLYLIMLGQFEDEQKDSMKIFNAVLFTVSHPGTFKFRTRRVIRDAYDERFIVTEKQRANLNKWEKGDAAKLASDADGDMSTETESDYDFDSDDSGF